MSQNETIPQTCRNVCWTWNNPEKTPEEALEALRSMPACTYVVFQKEQGENETVHYQGYSEFSKAIRWSAFRTALGVQPHCEVRRGTPVQADRYCRKEETRIDGPWSHGVIKSGGMGTRQDLIQFKDAIKSGKRMRELIDDFPAMVSKYTKFVSTVRGCTKKDWQIPARSVTLLIGPTNTGKTTWVHEKEPDLWKAMIGVGAQWFDNYDLNEAVLFDDFSGAASKIALSELLKLLHGFKETVPVKGSSVPWEPVRVYMTTNIKPQSWYNYGTRMEHWHALARRFTEVQLWIDRDTQIVLHPEDEEEWSDFWKEPDPPPVDTPFFRDRTQ